MAISPKRARSLLRRITSCRILVIGDVMLDHYIWGDATRISPEAPVPVIDIERDTWTAGGAANVAANIASLGAAAGLYGAFGTGPHAAQLKRIVAAQGISVIDAPAKGATIVKTRVMVQHQQLCRLDRESRSGAYAVPSARVLAALRRRIDACDAVIFSDYAKGLLSGELVAAVSSYARSKGVLVALDPKPKHPLPFSDLDLITPNRREALQLAGIELAAGQPFPAAQVCARLHERHRTRNVVVTLGEDGMLLCSGGRVLKTIPTAAREVFDVSGAGDTALAGLVLALCAGADLEEAAHFSNAAAGVVVAKLGTATVTPAELLAHVSRGS
jgi:D-glycero-beta-D-manno-heptose-7-phosphate kinase